MTFADPNLLLREAAAHFSAGRLDAAMAGVDQVLSLRSGDVNALHLKAQLMMRGNRADEAVRLMAQCVAAAPNVAMLQHNYAQSLRAVGDFAAAVDAFQAAIRLQPNYFSAYLFLGATLERLKRPREAADAYRTALRLQPNSADAWNGLGLVLSMAGNYMESETAFNRAIALSPNDPIKLYNLGRMLMSAGEFDRSIELFRKVIQLDPKHAIAHQNLANLLGESGLIEQTIAHQRRAIELLPADAPLHSNLLLSLQYTAAFTPQQVFEEHLNWAKRHAPPELRRTDHPNDRAPERRLKIGYLSPDFCRHPVASFLESVLTDRDREQFEIFAFSNTQQTDQMTGKLRGLVDQWRDIAPLPDDAAAKQIADDRIDILVDLAGHTSHNRATLMARRAAPVQMTYLGYPDTTGMSAVQHRITDAYADPPGMTESLYSEDLLRLPDCFLCYRPDDDVPEPTEPPTARNGFVTFGSYNNFAKVTEPMMRLWATILSRVPNSRLLLKARALASRSAKERVAEIFARYGIDSDRLSMVGWVEYAQRHAIIQQSDIALDAFPYHGTTTTCEVLWAGVPWITLAGRAHVSRVGVSILSNVGLADFIAANEEEYANKAISLASDPQRLAKLRSELRERMQASPLLKRDAFARKLETAYREVWRKWCDA
jgi:predicted O-linked N-acetylglucosamine transferase (SPINDLY family)